MIGFLERIVWLIFGLVYFVVLFFDSDCRCFSLGSVSIEEWDKFWSAGYNLIGDKPVYAGVECSSGKPRDKVKKSRESARPQNPARPAILRGNSCNSRKFRFVSFRFAASTLPYKAVPLAPSRTFYPRQKSRVQFEAKLKRRETAFRYVRFFFRRSNNLR